MIVLWINNLLYICVSFVLLSENMGVFVGNFVLVDLGFSSDFWFLVWFGLIWFGLGIPVAPRMVQFRITRIARYKLETRDYLETIRLPVMNLQIVSK